MNKQEIEWKENMKNQLIKKKGLSEPVADKACDLFRSEYVGQNSHALWQWAISKASEE